MPDAALPKVLIVDDDDDIRSGLRYMLEQLEDFEITEAGDGQVALDAMAREKFDLVLLDVNLPIVNGDVVMISIGFSDGYHRPGYLVIMSAASNLAPIQRREESVIVDKFLVKPFKYEDIQEIVTAITTETLLDDLGD